MKNISLLLYKQGHNYWGKYQTTLQAGCKINWFSSDVGVDSRIKVLPRLEKYP